MDPDRVRAYLQVACAGLGFDIGEIWWTSSAKQQPASAAIDENGGAITTTSYSNHLKFVQLYTSKSYEKVRSTLVNPDEDEEDDPTKYNSNNFLKDGKNLDKHVLSPQLVNAISKSAQILWAHGNADQQQNGLLGRSDVRLQTAVGLPVAVDDTSGSMCVVVMFSPNHVPNSEEAVEYLQFISQSATSSTIPCLLPCAPNMRSPPLLSSSSHKSVDQKKSMVVSDGVTATFLTNREPQQQEQQIVPKEAEDTSLYSMSLDPLLLLNSNETNNFDETSYAVWNTIMDMSTTEQNTSSNFSSTAMPKSNGDTSATMSSSHPTMPQHQRDRLEEFITAFLGMSVFDAADIWIPGASSDSVYHVSSLISNDSLQAFRCASEGIQIKAWNGAVGRAYASVQPVWSHVKHVICDPERASAFHHSQIRTALAVPLANKVVICFYSLVRTDAVPFVLRFVTQALSLLWQGLDSAMPSGTASSNNNDTMNSSSFWNEVGPSDLGEMAADLEMHQEFLSKNKRSHSFMTDPSPGGSKNNKSSNISSLQIQDVTDNYPSQPISSNSRFSIEPYHEDDENSDEANNSNTITNGKTVSESPSAQASLEQHQQQGDKITPWASTNSKRTHLAAPPGVAGAALIFSPSTAPLAPLQGTSNPNNLFHMIPLQMPNQLPNHIVPPPQAVTSMSHANHTSEQQPSAQHFSPSPASTMPSHPQQNQQPKNSSQPPPPPIQQQPPHSFFVAFPQGFQQQQPSPAQPPINNQQAQQSVPPKTLTPTQNNNMYLNQNGGTSNIPQQPQYCYPCDQVPSSTSVAEPTPPAPTRPKHNAKVCRIQGCDQPPASRRPYCIQHSGNRICERDGCSKCAQGSTRFCIAHGGGRRCTYPGCDKGARDKYFCAAHGGGKRCSMPGCTKSAVGGSNLCTGHGGGRRCAVEGCDKSAQSSTKFCVKHGGGKKCLHPQCEKVARGRTSFCAAHGGGIRCKLEGCNRVAIGKLQLCRSHGGGSSKAAAMRAAKHSATTNIQTPTAVASSSTTVRS